MMRRAFVAIVCAAFVTIAAAVAARAQDEDELNRIPAPAPSPSGSPPAPAIRHLSGKVFVENATSVSALRGGLAVPYPTPLPASWENRTSLDVLEQWDAGRVSATLSNRLNVTEQKTFAFPSSQTLRNDLREAFASLSVGRLGYVEAGRINVRNGVALGFNPTDFFKTRTLVDQASLDPTVIRQDRLGTVVTRLEAPTAHGTFDFIYAPRLATASAISYVPSSGLNPRFDRTNSANRFELRASQTLGDLNPQEVVHVENGVLQYGVNVSHEASKAVVVYGEWAGGAQPDLIARALAYGKATGTLPATAPAVLPNDGGVAFRNDASLGASWTGTQKLTVNVEYEYHQGGLSRVDWQNWTNASAAAHANPAIANELWYIRGYAADQQEPLVRQQLFIRADQTDAFVAHLELTGIAFVNLYDGSLLTQLAATYDASDRWSFAVYLNAYVGGGYTERGSFPTSRGFTIQVRRYL